VHEADEYTQRCLMVGSRSLRRFTLCADCGTLESHVSPAVINVIGGDARENEQGSGYCDQPQFNAALVSCFHVGALCEHVRLRFAYDDDDLETLLFRHSLPSLARFDAVIRTRLWGRILRMNEGDRFEIYERRYLRSKVFWISTRLGTP